MADVGWGDLLRKHSPELDAQSRADQEFLNRNSALTVREKLLMATILDSVANRPAGVRKYSELAIRAGATKEQIVEVLVLLRMFGGRPGLVSGCEALRQFEA